MNLPFDAVPEGPWWMEVTMYSGHLMDELMQMVTRAESHAQQLKVATEAEPDPGTYFVPRFAYERTNQPVHAGVA
jgi:hypothetical protein